MTNPVPTGDHLVLIGPMGAGKSSLARQLSQLTSRRWLDTDRMVVQRVGLPITEIFARFGEPEFRRLETEALDSLRQQRPLIIATGGGIVTQPKNVAMLREMGCVVFLTATPEVLFERVSRNRQRPLLHTSDPERTLREIVSNRMSMYQGAAHLTLATSDGTHERLARLLLDRARDFFAAQSARVVTP